MKQNLILFTCLFLLCVEVFAQNGTIKGVIIDDVTSLAIENATVTINNKSTITTKDGIFEIADIPAGNCEIIIKAQGFTEQIIAINADFSNAPNQTFDMGTIKMSNEISAADGIGIADINLSGAEFDNENRDQNISGLLHSSSDVFSSTAGYTLSAGYFRTRGYDSENSMVLMNGILVNDPELGRASWSEWGGLNDATRNKEFSNSIGPADFSFGSVGGATNIITRASQYRKQQKVSYSMTNRMYTHRMMYTHSTGLMNNGWAITASGSRRWSNNGYVEGTFYDAWAYFIAVEKKINKQHSVGLTAFGAPTRRGQQMPATQEAYDLMGTNYYNPNWGYQDGEKRNSRIKTFHEPMIILNHYWDINEKIKLTNAFAYTFGKNGGTALNWYNAADPRPDYYRYLPSYQTDPAMQNAVADYWKNNDNVNQIDWNRLYQINYLANNEGTQARYIMEDRHNDQQQFQYTGNLQYEINEMLKLSGGLNYSSFTGIHYKEIEDLLGGQYWLDIDQFAERDFRTDTTVMQNDLNNPNRKVKEGDKFGYHYEMHVNQGSAWVQQRIALKRWDLFIAANASSTTFWRDGKMKNGRAPENSYGASEKQSFFNYGVKLGGVFKITGRHFIEGNATYQTRAPFVRNAYYSPRVKATVADNLTSETIYGGEINYHWRAPYIKTRITAYQTYFLDQVELTSGFHDQYNTYINYSMSDIDKIHQGIEIGADVKATSSINILLVAAKGNYRYLSRPKNNVSYENGSKPDVTEDIYIKNFYLNGTPQTAGSFGVKYRHPKFWFFSTNFNYFADNYIDINPERRTSLAMDGLHPDDPLVKEISKQEKFDAGYTIDASIGKSIKIKKFYINLNFSINNILDNQEMRTSGFEQNRFDFDDKNINKFPPKYFYAFGRNYYLNVAIRL